MAMQPSATPIMMSQSRVLQSKLAVVILNWNLPEDTITCIESLGSAAGRDMQIIVVDNGSTDDSVMRFRQHFGSAVTLVQNGSNLGFAAGVNVGIERALADGAEYVLLLNNDTIVASDMIDRLLSAASAQPRAGVVAPVIYYHDEPQRIWRYADKQYRWFPVPMQCSPSALEGVNDPFHVDYVTGCGVLISRAVFEAIGGFDARYVMYFEDADFCRRARAAGFEIWCVPQARMWHKVSLSAQKDKPASRYAQSWGRAHFYRQHPHGPFAC